MFHQKIDFFQHDAQNDGKGVKKHLGITFFDFLRKSSEKMLKKKFGKEEKKITKKSTFFNMMLKTMEIV